jgi:hypothetical protein
LTERGVPTEEFRVLDFGEGFDVPAARKDEVGTE